MCMSSRQFLQSWGEEGRLCYQNALPDAPGLYMTSTKLFKAALMTCYSLNVYYGDDLCSRLLITCSSLNVYCGDALDKLFKAALILLSVNCGGDFDKLLKAVFTT